MENEEMTQVKIQIGQTISYQDMANPYREGVIVEIHKVSGSCFLLFGGSKPFEEINEEATVIYPGSWHRSLVPVNGIKQNEYAGHQLVDKPILSQEEINKIVAEYERMQPILEEQRRQSEIEKKQKDESKKSKIRKDFPYLISIDQSKLSGAALGAKNIKIELTRAFPDVKFSVKSQYYSMGCSIDVDWNNGPSRKEVEKITSKYQYGHFDGMIDLYEYHDEVWTDVFGGAKYVSENRKISDDVATQIAKEIAKNDNREFTNLDAIFDRGNSFENWMGIVWRFVEDKDLTHFKGIKRTDCTCGTYPDEWFEIVEG